jgi:hypothetical protein
MNVHNQGQPDQNIIAKGLQMLGALPSPEKLFAELQRLNANLERMNMPQALIEIQRLNNNIERLQLNSQDLRALATALQGMNLSQLQLLLVDANSTIKALYEKLWGQVPKPRK